VVDISYPLRMILSENRFTLFGIMRRTRHADCPLIGHVVAEQDIHQRGLAGAVLAEQREDFAAPQLQVDRVIGDKRAEALADAGKRQDQRLAVRGQGITTTSCYEDILL